MLGSDVDSVGSERDKGIRRHDRRRSSIISGDREEWGGEEAEMRCNERESDQDSPRRGTASLRKKVASGVA